MSREWIRMGTVFALTCCAVVLGRICAKSNDMPIGTKDTLKVNKELTQKLGGTERYLTLLSTDKPIYKEGEKVYVRGVILNAADHKPLPEGRGSNATVEIKGPKGDVVAGGGATAQDSVWGFAWSIPTGQAGGEYTVKVSYPWEGHAPAERKFDIRAYRPPRLKSQITFMRDGYAPGDKVSATLDVKRAEGGVPANAKVNVTARVDGIEIDGGIARVDEKGLCTVTFDLPREIPRGDGTLALVIEDGGVVETASKTIPILLQTVDLQMFPEGGDLIAGYKNRVYLQAKQPNGKPADLVGKIMSKDSLVPVAVAEFKTEHEGRGRFEFVPEANKEYFLAVTQPAGIKTTFPLPKAKAEGALLHSDKDIFSKGQAVNLQVGCTEKKFRVSLSKRDEELDAYKVDFSKRDFKPGVLHNVSFEPPANVDGVLTVTVWNEQGAPIAERLVYREAAHPLKISITPEKKSYVPGDNAKLTVKATDENGNPVSAVVGLTVTDDSVLEMVEKRDQAPRLPVMLFIEPEVKDLADAHVYLDSSNPKAPLATDLLLGTQGWRRYAFMEMAKFIEQYGDQARRVLALKIQTQMEQEKAAQLAQAQFEDADGGAPMGGFNMMARRGAAIPPGAVPMMMPNAPMPKAAAVPMPVVAAAGPHAAVRGALMKRMDKVAFFNAPREVQIIDERPIVRDFRQAQDEGVAMDFIAVNKDAELEAAIKNEAVNEKKKQIIGAGGGGRGFAANFAARDFVVVREFAHQVRPDRKPTDRVDFEETLYWNAGVKTDAKTGEATISFGLNDSVSTFRVFADGFAGGGAVGAANVGVESVQPFYAEAKLPLEVTAGDQVLLPISLVNATATELAGTDAKINISGNFTLSPISKGAGDIGAGERIRWIQPIEVGAGNGQREFTLSAKSGAYEDIVTRKLSVKPKGFPVEVAFGGLLEPGKAVTHTITIPGAVVAESVNSNTAVYPTPLANLSEALARLIQDPYGCFEQTSSTSYPLTMAQQYFVSHTGVDPKLVETSKAKLEDGYKKLVGFWCPDRGYEWFGENPGHEALTAFGLLHFVDMSKVREVDQNMISTTRAWLLKQKDGKGGFTRKRRSLHTWTEDPDCSSAYILWALLETGQPSTDLKAELDATKAAAEKTKNNYTVALAANALYLAGQKADAKKLMDRLASKQKEDGSVDGMTCSIVGSGGEALQIEGASLATLAWLRDPAYAGNVEKSIKFLADSCKAGRYGSTQSTVLALRAIVTYDKQRAHPKAPGKVRLFVDGQSIGDWIAFDSKTEGAIKLPDLSELLTPGEHKLELRMDGGGTMPYSMAVKYNALTPASSKECKLDLAVNMAQEKVAEGASTEANVTVTNKTKDVLPTPVAIVGLPGGLEPRHDQLKELVKKGTIDAYEVLGREVVLYWRTMPAEAKVQVPLSLIAAVPGNYTAPASRAYLYYTDEHKQWTDGVKVQISPK